MIAKYVIVNEEEKPHYNMICASKNIITSLNMIASFLYVIRIKIMYL